MFSIYDEIVTLDEASHTYTVKDYEHLQFSSVTEFIHQFFPKFNAEAQAEISSKTKNKRSKYYKKSPQEILAMWSMVAEMGTLSHNQIEQWVLDPQKVPHEDKAYHAYQWCLARFSENFHLFPEIRVAAPDLQLAGTIDLLVHDPETNRWAIVDWKTNEKIDNNGFGTGTHKATVHLPNSKLSVYSLQLNLYQYILEHYYNIKPDTLILVQLLPEPTPAAPLGCVEFAIEPMRPVVTKMVQHRLDQKHRGQLFDVIEEIKRL